MPIFARCVLAAAFCLTAVADVPVAAQHNQDPIELSADAIRKYGRVVRGITDLNGFLKAIEFERTAIIGVNYFAVSVGGLDAIKDLEEGRGVDPETLAGLYAGFAIPAVAEHLNMEPLPGGRSRITAPDGRLRYKGTVVRMYSPDHLRTLFLRRDGFRNDNDSQRRQAFSEYVYKRMRDVGELDRTGETTEISELQNRFQKLQPALIELQTALEGERQVSSALQSESTIHMFGLSLGGINVAEDLRTAHAVDPETLAAIYAQRVSTDYAASFQVNSTGGILFDGVPIKLYSTDHLVWCFKTRERLMLQAVRP